MSIKSNMESLIEEIKILEKEFYKWRKSKFNSCF